MIFLIILFALLGWLVGVALNHAADILPKRQTVFRRSACPHCGAQRSYADWSGLLVSLRGRQACPACGQPRPNLRRSVAVELITPLLFAFLAGWYGLSLQLGIVAVYTAILLLITITDLEHRLILNVVMWPAILFAIVVSLVTPQSGFWLFAVSCRSQLHHIYTHFLPAPSLFWQTALIGGGVGFVISFLAWLLATVLYGPGALGDGDVMLSLFLGLIVGFPYILLTFLIAVILGGVIPLLLMLTRRIGRRSVIPYGPFLTIAGWLVLVWGNQIWQYYFC